MRQPQRAERSRRWWAVVAALTGLVWTAGIGTAGAAGEGPVATAGSDEELAVAGDFSATGTFEATTECPSFHTTHTGEGSWTGLGNVTFVLDYCVVLSSEATSPLSGTIEITAAEGTLTGTLEGTVSNTPVPEGYPAHYTATLTGGTGAYDAATGTLELAGVWDDPVVPVSSMHGTISGTVNLPPPPLPHPSSIRDCLHGGWRNFVDDSGEAFDGPVACIIYVITHRQP